jgi:hypothetical protein
VIQFYPRVTCAGERQMSKRSLSRRPDHPWPSLRTASTSKPLQSFIAASRSFIYVW